jgi:hypothetical protein
VEELISACSMVVAALVAAGGLVLARKRSDANERKEEDRAAQRGLPPVPENEIGYVYSRLTDLRETRVVANHDHC